MSWLWLAAAVAFSPSLVELAQHALALPRDRISFVLAALLLVRFSLTTTRGARDARAGVALLGVAVLLQFFGILGDALTLGRASVAVAVIALSRITGRPAATGAILALWLVPIPISVLEPVRGPLENAAADAVAAFCGLLGSPALAVGPMVRVADSSLELRVSDAGLHLAHVLSLLGWYAAALRSEPAGRCAVRAFAWGVAGVPLAFAGLALASLAFLTSGPGSARSLLDHGYPLAVALCGLLLAERRRSLERPASTSVAGSERA